MFDPDCQNIGCPQCHLGKIYYDREIGFYCMYCGDQFNNADMEILIEKGIIKSQFVQQLEGNRNIPVVEIRGLSTRKTKVKHVSSGIVESKNPDR